MKTLRLLFIVCISFIVVSNEVNADVCDKNDIQRLNELASYVDVSYEYIDDTGVYNSYYVFINGLTDELYITSDAGDDYYYDQAENGVIKLIFSAGSRTFKVYSNRCKDVLLNKISVELPKINMYSLRDECQKLADYNLDICDRNYQGQITDDYFYNIVNSYLNNDTESESFFDSAISFLSDNYLVIIGSVVLVFIVIFAYFRNRKRSVLE